MTLRTHAAMPDISSDPFGERRRGVRRATLQLLGARFVFESESAELMRLVDWAFAGLPRHTLSARVPRLAVRLVLGGNAGSRKSDEPAPLAMSSGVGFLCGASPKTSMTAVHPSGHAALVVVERELLRYPYHARYELIEFAVFTLAARTQELMPLHAACVGSGSRGLLLIGDSGAGKSTAVLHCALEGLDVVSEDSLFVAPRTLLATGVANFLHVRRDSLRFLSGPDASLIRRAPIIQRRSGVRKFEVDLRRRRFRLAPRPLEIQGLVMLSARNAGGEPQLVPLARREAVARLRASQPYAAGQQGWRILAQRLRAVPTFELRRGRHPRDSAAVLRQLLHGNDSRR